VIAGVTDTHAALWYLLKSPRLSSTARLFIDSAAEAGNSIGLSPISLAEMPYLTEKNRLPASAYKDLVAAMANSTYVIEEAPFHAGVVDAMRQVSRGEIPDMPGRIVAATGIFLSVPVISRDGRIRASAVQTIW
jgi:PIN domain nuclease of toxin-antitoxin system